MSGTCSTPSTPCSGWTRSSASPWSRQIAEPGGAPRLTILVPVHFEQEVIATTLRSLEQTVSEPHRTLVIYDLDEDPTVGTVRAGAADWPHVELLKNNQGRGVLGALKTGFNASRSEYTVVFMADLSDDPAVINAMVAAGDGGYDVVSASRYMKGGSKQGGPWFKTLLSRTAGQSLHLLTRIPTHDATNAFRLYRRSFLEQVTIESTGGFEVTMELTIKAYLLGLPLTEVPANWKDRTAGESKFNFRQWLPHYLRWYLYAVLRAPLGLRLARAGAVSARGPVFPAERQRGPVGPRPGGRYRPQPAGLSPAAGGRPRASCNRSTWRGGTRP
ncbi:MAG: glycosyltransferase, partial [Candidatus Dormibacteria bacterium]